MGADGKHWKRNDWALSRKAERFGERQDKNVQVNELPEVGDHVFVAQRVNYSRTRGKRHVSAIYACKREFRDSFNKEKEFVVASYTNGKDNPLDRKNFVRLERRNRDGEYLYHVYIRTVEIAIGIVALFPYKDFFLEKHSNMDDAIPAEYGVRCGNKAEPVVYLKDDFEDIFDDEEDDDSVE